MAFAHAEAARTGVPLFRYFALVAGTENKIRLPVPMMNILNGGTHARNSTDLQEFMIMPHGAPTFKEALRYGAETFHALKKILTSRNFSTSVGDEGGFAPELQKNEDALAVIMEAIKNAGYEAGKDISIALDPAATEFYENGTYNLATENKKLTSTEMVTLYKEWATRYPIVSIEDGLAEDDWEGFRALTAELGDKTQVVGDDLFVTNTERLKKGIQSKAANAILIKLNQIGTVTETIETVKVANAAEFASVISHRSGETEDTTIADFAVGLGTGQIKTGSASRGERTAKYNRLLRIEEILGAKAIFAGNSVLRHG
ncbi:phosphopyruvate hydratase [Candidatus Kaiserbacteria bacterium]|nr:phosphopyruvate hydratase [Candidatus Kaiserbacteria bacterium]